MNDDHHTAPETKRETSQGELAVVERVIFGRNRLFWVGVLAVLIPLAVLLGLQYSWLTDLQHNSAVARRTTLENTLKAVASESRYFYSALADRALNLPPAAYTEETIQQAAHFLASRDLTGARRIFIITYQPIPRLFFYDAPSRTMLPTEEPSPDAQAVWVAAAPWSTLHKTLGEVRLTGFSVEEHDASRRIIINAITDENDFLFAITGLIVDRDHFVSNVLPDAVAQSLPSFDDAEALWVSAHDRFGRCVFPDRPCPPAETDRIARNFDFVFTDWTISLQGRLAVPEQWERFNFAFNVTLSAALAVVLMGGIVFTVRTAIKEMKLSAMKNEFVSNVSHELRTPLASIRVFGELMRHGRVNDPAKVSEYGSHIEAESRRLSQLINNILDFSRIEAGQKIYAFESTSLEQLVSGTLEAYRLRLKNQGFELEFESPDEPLPLLSLDAGAMDRAIANLLDNAIKYSNDGGRITVRVDRTGPDVVLSISDDGIGIPPDEHERVFDRFHRVGTGLVHDVKGSGLGLSLVQHIVRAHGGRVRLESELGKGSTFFIHLPIDRDVDTTKEGHNGRR
ncbi:MAG: HAMP domain-containing sensor histidine kinase [Thermoanaerobaculales bacterium]|jgi:signal transduction histidine kinase|nr:HAMP domain-containing sensor histidine kinase [Thermoanaerobaculales bacterium]